MLHDLHKCRESDYLLSFHFYKKKYVKSAADSAADMIQMLCTGYMQYLIAFFYIEFVVWF